jgi:hypothetical protein
MNASMTSCAQLFECSHPALDALTALARSAGAYGARLTGAGWGGCAVALVREDSVPAFIEQIRAGYEGYAGLDDAAFGQAVFATKPSSGACGESRMRAQRAGAHERDSVRVYRVTFETARGTCRTAVYAICARGPLRAIS